MESHIHTHGAATLSRPNGSSLARHAQSEPRTLPELVGRLERIEARQNPDMVLPLKELRMEPDGTIFVPTIGRARFTEWSRSQVASLAGLKWPRWFENADGELQAKEMNGRFARATGEIKLRSRELDQTEDGVRHELTALVSPGYVPVPDSRLAKGLVEALATREPEMRLIRSHITDRTTSYVVKAGDAFNQNARVGAIGEIWGSILVVNSAVGFASVKVIAFFKRILCMNGMTAPMENPELLRSAHRGKLLDRLHELLNDALPSLSDKLHQGYDRLVASLEHRLGGKPGEAILGFLRDARLPIKLAAKIAEAYALEPSLTRFGVAQAVTRAAQSLSPEERFELERTAGRYLTRIN